MGISLKKGRLVSVRLPFRSESFSPESRNGRHHVWVWTAAEVLAVSGQTVSVAVIDPSTCIRIRAIELMIDAGLIREGAVVSIARY